MSKFRKLLVVLSKNKELVQDIITEMLDSTEFILFVAKTKDWTNTEHDGLLNLLDFNKTNGYYRDKYNKRVSYNGIATLKHVGTEMNLNILHEIEISKVKEDYLYFKKYYSFIVTRNGIDRGESREYQHNLDRAFMTGEDLVVSFSRQSGKTVGAANYILHSCIARKDPFNCGIVGNRESTAAEVLDKIKKILVSLPIWLAPNIDSWNTRSIEFENTTRIMTSRPHGDAFRGFSISLLYCDEVAYYANKEWSAFCDSVFPTMASLIVKQSIFTSTAKGLNHWAHMVSGARAQTNGYKLVENNWKDVPRYSKEGKYLTPAEYRAETIKKYGEKFFKSTEENLFLGSSTTLISGEVLKNLNNKETINNPEIFHLIKLYEERKPKHSYIIGVDPSGDGIDNFGIQVIDITRFPFKQVAAAALQVDYLIMAEHLSELGTYYNNAFITVETNDGIGTSIVDTLWHTYEYSNLFKDRDANNKRFLKRFGFRTTSKSRNLILGLLKVLVEENKINIVDKTTISELLTFELNENGKYCAADGAKDDMIMSLAIALAPFTHIKVMDDHKLFLEALRFEIIDDNGIETADYYSTLDIGGFSDGDETYAESRSSLLGALASGEIESSFDTIRRINSMNKY